MNELKAGRLTGEFLGELEFSSNVKLLTLNVRDEWVKHYPVATFHGPLMIKFHWGKEWFVEDLKNLIELHDQWQKKLEEKE